MKQKCIGGMRDIPTIQGLRNHSVPTTRAQAVTELARLEHEKARLERELNMWIGNQKKTEKRLQRVEERLTHLQQVLQPPVGAESPKRQPRRSSSEKADSGGGETPGWREISLEY